MAQEMSKLKVKTEENKKKEHLKKINEWISIR